MKRALVLFLALAGLTLRAQEKDQPAPSPTPAVKVFVVKPSNFERVRDAVRLIAGGSGVSADRGTNTLVVTTSPTYMPAIEQLVKQLDVVAPTANIELTFYIVQGSREPAAEGAPLPNELQPVANQLKSVFGYLGLRLLDTAFVRSRSNQNVDVTGSLAVQNGRPSIYSLALNADVMSDSKAASIRLDRLRFSAKIPYVAGENTQYYDFGFNANIDIKEGQKVVIGKTSLEGGRSALILVATGKVVD